MLLFPDQENGQPPRAPKLKDAVEAYTGRSLIGAHRAMADTLATMQLLKEMVRGCLSLFFVGYQRGGLPPAGHTQQSGKPDCRGPEAEPHQRDTPNTPIPGGAQCPKNSMGVEPTHLLGVLEPSQPKRGQ
jgi:hypothetical protein